MEGSSQAGKSGRSDPGRGNVEGEGNEQDRPRGAGCPQWRWGEGMPTVSLPPGLKSQGAELRPLLALSSKTQAPRSPEFPTSSREQTWELRAPTDPSGHPVLCQQLRGVSRSNQGTMEGLCHPTNLIECLFCVHARGYLVSMCVCACPHICACVVRAHVQRPMGL